MSAARANSDDGSAQPLLDHDHTTTSVRNTMVVTVLCVMPYFLCKLCIAANTGFIEYFYGKIGGEVLASEADTLHWEFLWMGTAMGGMRALSIVVGTMQRVLTADSWAAEKTMWTVNRAAAFMMWGRKASLELATDEEKQRIGDVANLSWVATTLYGVVAAVMYYYSAATFFIAPDTTASLKHQIQEYGRGFAWGVLPIQWLYLNGQFALGLQAAAIPLLYDGIVNNLVATIVAQELYPTHGAYGLGVGMTVGAWVAWFLNNLHFCMDPHFRSFGITIVPPRTIIERARRLTSLFGSGGMGRRYFWFAVPLAISNMVGLSQGLVTAALVSQRETDDAMAYSISGAYYSTLSIAMLAISSVVSALMAACAPLGRSAPRVCARRRYAVSVSTLVIVLALALSVLPLIFPDQFGKTFGAKMYAFGEDYTRLLMPKVKVYNRICAVSFVVGTVANVQSAVLHGWSVMWAPTAINCVSGAVGILWSVAQQHNSTMVIAAGSIVAVAVQLVLLIAVFVFKWPEYFGSPDANETSVEALN